MAKVRTFCVYTLLYTEAHFFMYVVYYLITCAEWMASPDKGSHVWHHLYRLIKAVMFGMEADPGLKALCRY